MVEENDENNGRYIVLRVDQDDWKYQETNRCSSSAEAVRTLKKLKDAADPGKYIVARIIKEFILKPQVVTEMVLEEDNAC